MRENSEKERNLLFLNGRAATPMLPHHTSVVVDFDVVAVVNVTVVYFFMLLLLLFLLLIC